MTEQPEIINHMHTPSPTAAGNGCDECTSLRESEQRRHDSLIIENMDI